MRNLIYHVAVSMDGYIAGLDHDVSAFLQSGAHVEAYQQQIQQYDTVIMGKNTYTFGYGYGLKPGYVPYPHLENWVFSKTLKTNTADFKTSPLKVYSEESLAQIRVLKNQPGKPIWLCGGGTLATALYNHRLIDKVILKINPIVLGAGPGEGIALFAGKRAFHTRWHLVTHNIYDSGVIEAHYERASKVPLA